jgi:hypothetical protein
MLPKPSSLPKTHSLESSTRFAKKARATETISLKRILSYISVGGCQLKEEERRKMF